MINPNEPAFPFQEIPAGHKQPNPGMTIRCELAKAAMQGLLANPNEYSVESTINSAVEYADALIAALNAADTKRDGVESERGIVVQECRHCQCELDAHTFLFTRCGVAPDGQHEEYAKT